MRNVLDLRDELVTVFDSLKAGEMKRNDTKEMANVAGKIIGTVKLQLEYSKLTGRKPDIDFLNDGEKVEIEVEK